MRVSTGTDVSSALSIKQSVCTLDVVEVVVAAANLEDVVCLELDTFLLVGDKVFLTRDLSTVSKVTTSPRSAGRNLVNLSRHI